MDAGSMLLLLQTHMKRSKPATTNKVTHTIASHTAAVALTAPIE
jgi:hypothetical protein